MTTVEIWERLAEQWQKAAADTAQSALRRCYLERAAAYEQLARREGGRRAWPAAPRRDH